MSEPRITVSEDRLALLLEKLKNEIVREFEKYATRVEVEKIEGRLKDMELWRAAQNAMSGLKRWQVTVALALATIGAGLVGSLATFYWLRHG